MRVDVRFRRHGVAVIWSPMRLVRRWRPTWLRYRVGDARPWWSTTFSWGPVTIKIVSPEAAP
jgi:hypothetical protein